MAREKFGSVSLVRQGESTFYSLTIPSDILAQCCFVINRYDDPIEGFQRELDISRAQEIAAYIDEGLGTIPSSIVLSAQEVADLKYDSKTKTINFETNPKGFLIIDGQHRIYGFKLAKNKLRIPVIIYNGLSKKDETRLFIDINSKQKGVPPELLLDIKKMAEYESNQEEQMRNIFDFFYSDNSSCLLGKLSPAKKVDSRISRVVFNTAIKNILKIIGNKEDEEVYRIYNSYLIAINKGLLIPIDAEELLVQPTFFKALASFFIPVAVKVKDKFGSIYTMNHFFSIVEPLGQYVKKSKIRSFGSGNQKISEYLEENLNSGFTL
ncbi:DGQHR domain-containing protein [Treponema primitia]|uniref:DGQHR domain-containing protein n=1 Tax=Treponema primitia TaxID=88058 RepID=UPI0039812545